MTERDFATEVVERLQQAGFQALWAGGCVRDEQLGLLPADYDIATSAVPDQVMKLFRRCHSFGASFGVVEVLGPRGEDGEWLKVQVATFRSDGTYTDGRRPDQVTFSSPEEDAQRRDFTINGLFFDPIQRKVIDYVGGLADIQAKVLRAIGKPRERFTEDKLRLLRAVRMATRFELSIDPETLAAAQEMAPQISIVSAERIAEELRKLLTHKNRLRGVQLLEEFGLLRQILPEIKSETYFSLLELFAALPGPVSFELAIAALLFNSESRSANHVADRLKLSNEERQRITWLTRHRETLISAHKLTPAECYPLLVEPGIGELLALNEAHVIQDHLPSSGVDHCRDLLRTKTSEELNPPPLLTGDDLKKLGLKPSPQFKTLLQAVRDAQLNGELTTREAAEAWVKGQG